jgi:phosphonate transport system substrate-binding protein
MLGAAETDLANRPHTRLAVLCSTSLFRYVDRDQVIATAKLWLDNMGADVGWVMDTQIELADNTEVIRKKADDGTVDLVVTSALEYLAVDRPNLLKPAMTMTAGDDKGKVKYLLVVNRESGLSQIEDLKGKSVLAYSRTDPNLSRMWLEVMLKERHLASLDHYFATFSNSPKPSAACLPLFFGKTDACVIDGPSWDTLQELNPQVGAKLKVIAESPSFLESLVSVHVNRTQYRSDLLKNMLKLQDDPQGRQILVFFKTRRTVAIDAASLAEVKELRNSYLRSKAQKPAGMGPAERVR